MSIIIARPAAIMIWPELLVVSNPNGSVLVLA
jgi:hypothetical protein